MYPSPPLLILALSGSACVLPPEAIGNTLSSSSGASDSSSSSSTSGASDSSTSDSSSSGDALDCEDKSCSECPPSEEGIELPDVDSETAYVYDDVVCEVTNAGFLCAGSDEPVDIDALFGDLAPLPWDVGQQVTLRAALYPFTGHLIVLAEDESILATYYHVYDAADVEPLKLELEDVGCTGDAPELRVKYTLGEESISILGSDKGPLGDYTVFQESGADWSGPSAGELGWVVDFALIRTK